MLNPFLCCPGRGAGNSTQRVTEVTGRNLALVCHVRQEKVEISALNQKCDKSTGGVQGEGGLVHWLPVPPVPGLPPHQASVAGTTVLPGGWVLLVALSQLSKDAQCHGQPGRAPAEQSQLLGTVGWVAWP